MNGQVVLGLLAEYIHVGLGVCVASHETNRKKEKAQEISPLLYRYAELRAVNHCFSVYCLALRVHRSLVF